ncbi:MAG: Verru_Chthon cassette protein B [Verrucomicrobiota bacterium]
MKRCSTGPGKFSRPTAFSLIEVVLAIGVTSFALLSMVALLPIGLKTSREAADDMTQAQIVQYARNQLELTTFSDLAVWTTNPVYFDAQGLPTTANDPSQIYKATFVVTSVAFCSSTASSASPILIHTGPQNNNTNAMLVQMTVINRTASGPTATNVFPIVVPNAGF